ncbi:unnamed protein product [Linum tenue]|uniref:Uncharacterized protein n=1 Tax=Linum tenue TaxID=586396 RepID=A0AAV0H469_9ROSI|nr:unnamed protein product [Linum tenue]
MPLCSCLSRLLPLNLPAEFSTSQFERLINRSASVLISPLERSLVVIFQLLKGTIFSWANRRTGSGQDKKRAP